VERWHAAHRRLGHGGPGAWWRAGLPLRGFVTDDVAAYIAAQGLYRTTNE